MKTALYTSMIVIFVAVAGLVALIYAAPRFDWSATAKPGLLETTLAQYLVVRWIKCQIVLCDLSRVKECSNSGCGAFFYDTSKNRGRRWCTTTGCGNRMRVAAFYERQRQDG